MRPRIVKTANANDRGDGLADRPGGDVEAHRRRPLNRRLRSFRRSAAPGRRPQESGGARDHAFAVGDARLDFHPSAVDDARLHLPHLDLAVAHDVETRLIAVPLQRGRWNANALATARVRPGPRRRRRYGRAKRRQARSGPCRCGSPCRPPGSRAGRGPRPGPRRPAASVPPACRRRASPASARARRPRDRSLRPR